MGHFLSATQHTEERARIQGKMNITAKKTKEKKDGFVYVA